VAAAGLDVCYALAHCASPSFPRAVADPVADHAPAVSRP